MLATPLTFAGLGGDGRLDRGVGVVGGLAEEVELELPFVEQPHVRRYFQILFSSLREGVRFFGLEGMGSVGA